MSPSRKSVVTFGELLLRLDPATSYERLVQADAFKARYTGAEANVAASLACFGIDACCVSKVPDHEIGQACINYLRQYGVNTDFIARGGQRLGLLYVETGNSQRPSKVVYDREHSSIRDVKPDDFDWKAILAGKQWFHFSGTAPALGENVRRVLSDAVRAAGALGVKVSCDCNYRSKLWSPEEAGRVLGELMKNVTMFIGGREDAEKLFGIKGAQSNGHAGTLLAERFGFEYVAMTVRSGESASVNRLGGLLCTSAGCFESREYEMQIVDRVGGGDAFTAGLLYGILSDFDPQRTVDFAAAASCLKHSIPGDFNLISVDEVEQLLEGGQAGRVQR